MNLFVESLTSYLKQEWDRTLNIPDGQKKALFVLQSLPPQETLAVFEVLEEHRLHWLQGHSLDCHFKVATGLWNEWNQNTEIAALLRQHDWVDKEDRLTWYRNLPRPADKDGLVVVLVGLDHATDQGGLSDFHRVDEQRVWRTEMGESFKGWIRALNRRYALEATDSEVERFDAVLQQLFKLRPRQLAKLAVYLERVVGGGQDLATFAEFVQRFYWRLPFWGIPPLRVEGRDHTSKKGIGFLKDAEAFIAHQRLKTKSEQDKVWKKLTQAFAVGDLERPEELDDAEQIYTDSQDFRNTLHAYIHNADADAKARLLRADLLPVLKILRGRETKVPKERKTPKLSGISLEVMLQAVWHTLGEFQTRHRTESLNKVQVVLVDFKHDLADDEDEGLDGKEMARALLLGCLGGLEQFFEQIDWCLPVDTEQAQLPHGQWSHKVPLALDLTLTREENQASFRTSRKRPHVLLRVEFIHGDDAFMTESEDDDDSDEEGASSESGQCCFKRVFRWEFGPTQPERVRYQCAKAILDEWQEQVPGRWMLPGFGIANDHMTALYFAADDDEANRLIAQGLSKFRLNNLLNGLNTDGVDHDLRN